MVAEDPKSTLHWLLFSSSASSTSWWPFPLIKSEAAGSKHSGLHKSALIQSVMYVGTRWSGFHFTSQTLEIADTPGWTVCVRVCVWWRCSLGLVPGPFSASLRLGNRASFPFLRSFSLSSGKHLPLTDLKWTVHWEVETKVQSYLIYIVCSRLAWAIGYSAWSRVGFKVSNPSTSGLLGVGWPSKRWGQAVCLQEPWLKLRLGKAHFLSGFLISQAKFGTSMAEWKEPILGPLGSLH